MEKVSCLALTLAMAAAATVLIVTPCAAQNSAQDFVDLHNAARSDVSVSPVSWDDNIAAFAQSCAGDCALQHSSGSGYSENIFVGGAGADWSASDAVGMWVAEKQWYDHDSNTCAAGQVCGHYTQVVWRDSATIGCARAVCNYGVVFITCNCNPPGNLVRQSPY